MKYGEYLPYPTDDKEILDKVFDKIHDRHNFFLDHIIAQQLKWDIDIPELIRLRNLLIETGCFEYSPYGVGSNIVFTIKSDCYRKIKEAGSYSQYLYNNGMGTQSATLNRILIFLSTKGVNIPYSVEDLSNDAGFHKDLIEAAKIYLKKAGYVSASKQEMSLTPEGKFFITHGGYTESEFNSNIHVGDIIDRSVNAGGNISDSVFSENYKNTETHGAYSPVADSTLLQNNNASKEDAGKKPEKWYVKIANVCIDYIVKHGVPFVGGIILGSATTYLTTSKLQVKPDSQLPSTEKNLKISQDSSQKKSP